MTTKIKIFLFMVLLFPIISGCSLMPFRPFQLDINVKFDDETAQIIGTDSQGKVVVNRTIKQGDEKWQKSMALYSH